MTYSDELREEIDAFNQVISIWMDDPSRLEKLGIVGEVLGKALAEPAQAISLEMHRDVAQVLHKCLHLCIGLVMTADKLAREKYPQQDYKNN